MSGFVHVRFSQSEHIPTRSSLIWTKAEFTEACKMLKLSSNRGRGKHDTSCATVVAWIVSTGASEEGLSWGVRFGGVISLPIRSSGDKRELSGGVEARVADWAILHLWDLLDLDFVNTDWVWLVITEDSVDIWDEGRGWFCSLLRNLSISCKSAQIGKEMALEKWWMCQFNMVDWARGRTVNCKGLIHQWVITASMRTLKAGPGSLKE